MMDREAKIHVAVIRVLDRPAARGTVWSGDIPDPGTSAGLWRVYDIGNNQSFELMDYIAAPEKALGRTAEKVMLPLQAGDVPNVSDLVEHFGYKPDTSVTEGIGGLVD